MATEIPPTEKDPGIVSLLEGLTGVPRTANICALCRSDRVFAEDFRDELSRQEFAISRMCQGCQDEVFGTNDGEF